MEKTFKEKPSLKWIGLSNHYIFSVLLGLLIFSNFELVYGYHHYNEYWQEFTWKTWKKGRFQLSTYAKINTKNNLKTVHSFQLSEQLSYQVSDHFSMGFNYKYVHERSVVSNSIWKWQHRVEIELNPIFNSFCHSLIQTRNRLEIRKIENEIATNYRFRQRTMWVFPFKNHKFIKTFSLYNEIFYDISNHHFHQDRLCPGTITVIINKKLDLDVYFLIRFFFHEKDWRKSFILGTDLNF